MGDKTPDEIQAAVNLWKVRNPGPQSAPETRSDGSGDSERVSVFDRIEKRLKRPTEDARTILRKKQLREKIQKEEEAKTKLIIEKRVQEEEKKLKHKTKEVIIPSSDSEPERESKQEQLAKAFRDLKRKVEGDFEVGVAATPFTKSLEAIPREAITRDGD